FAPRRRNLSIGEQDLSIKVVAAINGMKKSGHDAHLHKHQGKMWVEIDKCMLATFGEIEELVDGVHSFEELEKAFRKRHAEELCGREVFCSVAEPFSSERGPDLGARR